MNHKHADIIIRPRHQLATPTSSRSTKIMPFHQHKPKLWHRYIMTTHSHPVLLSAQGYIIPPLHHRDAHTSCNFIIRREQYATCTSPRLTDILPLRQQNSKIWHPSIIITRTHLYLCIIPMLAHPPLTYHTQNMQWPSHTVSCPYISTNQQHTTPTSPRTKHILPLC